MPRITVLLAGLLLLIAGGSSHALTFAQEGGAAPPLVAAFETKTTVRARAKVQRERWTLARDASHVEYIVEGEAGRLVDAWTNTRAELTLTRVFPKERTLVEYSEGQLRALGNFRSWRQLGSLLPDHPAQLGLKRLGEVTVAGRKAVRYEGNLEAAHIVVSWLEQAQLPALMRLTQGEVTRTTTLQSLQLGQAERFETAELSQYRHIDAADLGDLEHDPFVLRHGTHLQAPHQH
jgi:hypothetical protein